MKGVYFLFYKRKLVYIGSTKNWPARIVGHKSFKFDECKIMECDDIRVTEARLIRILKPKYNYSMARKHVKNRIPDEFIYDNCDSLKGLIKEWRTTPSRRSKEFKPLINSIRTDFGYSPTTADLDIMRTLINGYERVFKFKEI